MSPGPIASDIAGQPTGRPAASTPAPSPLPLAARNRRNAKASTGPRSAAGKQIAARNALRHGLTANPARGTPEDAAAFDALLTAVEDRLRPQDVIEQGLVHRITVALWRQQRAVRAEAALAGLGVQALTHDHHEVHGWIARITEAWAPVMHEVPVEHEGGRRGRRPPPRIVWLRSRLAKLDALREDTMSQSGAAITAMLEMLESLADRLDRRPELFHDEHAEQMAWLLGDLAACMPQEERRLADRPNLTKHQRLIVEAMQRPAGSPLGRPMTKIIECRLDTLDHQRRYCQAPATPRFQRQVITGSLLPAGDTLDRLLRYETHADKTLVRALDTLARLRGVTVESLSTTVTTHHQGAMGMQVATGATTQVAASTVAVKPVQPPADAPPARRGGRRP